MVHFENLKPGDYIAVTNVKLPVLKGRFEVVYDGIPWRVQELSWPFVLCEYKGRSYPFDFRKVDFNDVNEQYAAEFKASNVITADFTDGDGSNEEEEEDIESCPRCKKSLEFLNYAGQSLVACMSCGFFEKVRNG